MEILDLCGFPNERLDTLSTDDLSELKLEDRQMRNDLDYEFNFKNQQEQASYAPLEKFLKDRGIYVRNVANGEGLIDGNLFDQELWTLKKNSLIPSCELSATEQSICKFIIRGRTDFVRLANPRRGITRINNQYFIEIKKEKIGEPELREAFYQLLGGNAGNSYRSPPVFITNLNSSHYVLFITNIGTEGILEYQLNIFRFPSFGCAISYLEDETKVAKSCTRDFLRRKTPLSSPPTRHLDEEELDEIEDFDSKMTLEPVFNDEDFEVYSNRDEKKHDSKR